jgi:hypothetical protein
MLNIALVFSQLKWGIHYSMFWNTGIVLIYTFIDLLIICFLNFQNGFVVNLNSKLFGEFIKKSREQSLHQVKVVVIEETIWRVLPFFILTAFLTIKYSGLSLLALNIVFTWLHFYKRTIKHRIVVIEFFLFYEVIICFFLKTMDPLCLYLPHLLRNISIMYLSFYKKNFSN